MAQSNDRASRSLAKWLGDLLEPGERPVVDVHLDAGYGRATVDIPDQGVTAVVTDRRIGLGDGVRKP
ncbi:MAG: hypothetical protein ACE5GC_09840, partial [Acidimicrobiia bacterium]